MNPVDPRFRILMQLTKDQSDAPLLIAMLSAAAALGFAFADGYNQNYNLMYGFFGKAAWAAIFGAHSIAKLLDWLYSWPGWAKTANGVLGVWAWNCMFLSFVVFDTTPMSPGEVVMWVPVMLECWALVQHAQWRSEQEKLK